MRPPLDTEISNRPAALRQTASKVILGLDAICHSQTFKLATLGARAHLPNVGVAQGGHGGGVVGGRRWHTFGLEGLRPVNVGG